MHAKEALASQVEKISNLLRNIKQKDTRVLLRDWEETYKMLRGIKGVFDTGGTVGWDVVERDVNAEWMKIARRDTKFKQYYLLRREADRLEALIK